MVSSVQLSGKVSDMKYLTWVTCVGVCHKGSKESGEMS